MEAAAAASSSSAAMEIIDSGCSTPYMTAPSSPPRLTSATFFSQFDHNPSLKDANFGFPSPSSSPKPFPEDHLPIDFAFHFSSKFHDTPLSADDLFHHGKIKPLNPLQNLHFQTDSDTEHSEGALFKTANSSPRSSPRRRNVFHEAFSSSPRKRKDVDLAPSSDHDLGRFAKREFKHNPVDHDPTFKLTKTRSLSPFPVSDMLFGDDDVRQSNLKTPPKPTTSSSFWNSLSFAKAYRKWKLKDLLFRSASEGRSTDKVAVDPSLMNYTILTKSNGRREDHNQAKAASSFRSSSDGSSSMKGSERRRGGVPVSAHELHYTVNRAVSEEMKRKTFLPYKQSLLGCLGFNPGGHEFPGRVGSTTLV